MANPTAEELKAAADAKAEAEAKATVPVQASEAEVRAALVKGSIVKVSMPQGVSSINIAGAESQVDEDGFVMLHVKHALHAVEAFGGLIVTEAKKPFVKPVAK